MKTTHMIPNGESGQQSTFRGTMQLLLVEDVESDALMIELELRNASLPIQLLRVDTAEEYLRALREHRIDAVLSDYHLPSFTALTALSMLKKMNPDIPFILVTGSQSEEIAVECIKQGADDYLLKASLARLPSALINAIQKRKSEKERQEMIVELRNSRQNLRALSAHLQSVREVERTRIAREIHDELGQALTALKMDVLWLHGKISNLPVQQIQPINETIRSMTSLIDATIHSVRRIATDLRPGVLDDLGLIPAIEWQSQEFQKRTGITTKFSSTVREATIDREYATAIFRILQESLTNVARHSHATKAHIRFEITLKYYILTIEDNGRGITSEEINSARSLGLLGMRERGALLGGEIDVIGTPGVGTIVSATMPRPHEERKTVPP